MYCFTDTKKKSASQSANMYYTLKASTAALCTAATVLAASIGEKSSRSLQFSVGQIANPKYTGPSGVLSLAKTYTKYDVEFPSGLQNALSQQFPGWDKTGE